MRQGSKVEFIPDIFPLNSWITCVINKEKVNAKIRARISDRKYEIKIPLFNKAIDNLMIGVQNGRESGLYEFEGELLEGKSEKNIYQLIISKQGRRIQERRYKRINIYHTTTFIIVEKPLFTGNQYSANVEDISAGGAKLVTAFKLVSGNVIELGFTLADFPFASLRAEVVRKKQLARINNRIYDIGVEFLCSEEKRKQIKGYVNKKQIEYKEAGLL